MLEEPKNSMGLWYLHARHKFVWDTVTLEKYVQILAEVVYRVIEEFDNHPIYLKQLASPNVGLFHLADDKDPTKVTGYALYISDARLHIDKRRTIFSDFKSLYEIAMGRAPEQRFHDDKFISKRFPKEQAARFIQRRHERLKLIGDFNKLAERSINHRREVSAHLRYKVLSRDKFTCQSCGRSAPDVRLHVDHLEPVSWGTNWKTSNDPSDYQTLCEDCNLGKGDLSWIFTS